MTELPASAVRPEVGAAVARAWEEIAGPGAWWDGPERVAIAAATRAARAARAGEEATIAAGADLPAAAQEAVEELALRPGHTSEAWVDRIVAAIGEARYVELVGVAARVTAMDTFARLTGAALHPLPPPRPGRPTAEPAPPDARRNHTWVAMARPAPPYVLGAVPSAMRAMNDLTDVLYLRPGDLGDPDRRRGELHRTQIELVAAATSIANECFY